MPGGVPNPESAGKWGNFSNGSYGRVEDLCSLDPYTLESIGSSLAGDWARLCRFPDNCPEIPTLNFFEIQYAFKYSGRGTPQQQWQGPFRNPSNGTFYRYLGYGNPIALWTRKNVETTDLVVTIDTGSSILDVNLISAGDDGIYYRIDEFEVFLIIGDERIPLQPGQTRDDGFNPVCERPEPFKPKGLLTNQELLEQLAPLAPLAQQD